MKTLPPHPPTASASPPAALSALLRATVLALLVGAMLFSPQSAGAGVAPQFLPNRDVEVQYTVTMPGQPPHDYDLSFSAESERLRIDDPVRGLWFLVDLRDASAALVVPQMRVVVTEPDLANLAAILQSAGAAQFTPLGEVTIAGLRCTRYMVFSEHATGTTCLTRGGIALAVSGQDSHGSAQVLADSVAEATVPPDSLVPPADFSSIALPSGIISALLGN
jgi:hypothetical protein